ncbi:hypothetical protein BDE02_01G171800 [Populus trichocarpa]|nr:hypothetical protein BDE02_01G171800 [Populus trichocarpa]
MDGTDENDQSYQGRSLNVQNPKKPLTTTATKHFMSPTISAASKANPPRRKILAESNGSLDTHPQKTPTFGSKTISSIEFAEYGENVLLDHLSSRPYDPLTSYISPRPFLRYKPNRHRDIFLRRENEAREETSTSLADVLLKKMSGRENEEIFKEILLLLVVLVLSTSYIPSMKSPTPSPVMQAFGNPKNGFHMVQDHSGNRNYTLVQNGAGIDEEEMMDYEVMGEDEYDDELDEAVEKQNGESEVLKIVEAEEKETIEGFGEGGETELGSVVETQAGEHAPEMVKAGEITEPTTMSGSPFINDGDDSLAMPSSIPENFEKENEVANEPVTKEVVDGGIGSGWNTTGDQAEYFIACLTLAFHFKRKRNAQKDSSPVVQPSFEPVVVEKCLPMFASEADKNCRVPSVVFLGEFEVGEISSLRSCGMETRMTESEVISIRSVSMEKGMVTMTHSVPVHVQPAFSEISTMDPPPPHMEDSLLRRKS